jgi:hypothetical protein
MAQRMNQGMVRPTASSGLGAKPSVMVVREQQLGGADWLRIDFEPAGPLQWGWRWASKAAEAGASVAAAEPLPGDDEEDAQSFAQDFLADAPSARIWAQNVAETSAWLAIDSYREYVRRVSELREAKSFSHELTRKADEALGETESFGRLAAMWNRVHMLVESAQ